MRLRKHERERKRQRGQYMTPPPLARKIVSGLTTDRGARILEPSCGDGAFLSAILEKLSDVRNRDTVGGEIEIVGIEIDSVLARTARSLIENSDTSGVVLRADVRQADFFQEYLSAMALGNSEQGILGRESFDLIVGNPPFGGTFDRSIEDALDDRLGNRLGKKIKKETYSFFIVACIDLLRPGGRLVFVCSDTLLTIPTMTGLRHLLMERGTVALYDIDSFSEETDYPMLILDFTKRGRPGGVSRNSERIDDDAIRSTPNLSWGITKDLSLLFSGGPLLGDFFVASSGMTTGKNDLFVREIDRDNSISEPYQFEFYDAPVTLDYELERARLGKLSEKRIHALRTAQAAGETERRLRVTRRDEPLSVRMPDPRYRPYNKANSRLLFSPPTHGIYWEDEGDAVLTYKRTGNWYLRGVGGQPYFGREGRYLAANSKPVQRQVHPTRIYSRQRLALRICPGRSGPRRDLFRLGVAAYRSCQSHSQDRDKPHPEHPEQRLRANALSALGERRQTGYRNQLGQGDDRRSVGRQAVVVERRSRQRSERSLLSAG